MAEAREVRFAIGFLALAHEIGRLLHSEQLLTSIRA
jgi:hypothetical protein